MAEDQQAEVQLAQRLASNERPVRTRAMKKLRKYISVRSQQAVFSGEELLKLWKGLFYCLWMQDKPLLQEELSRQISTLIHGFHTTEQQLSYLQSFLQTIKREWTGIDQLRMDKFFQLVRFMFRQALEVLRRRSWDSSMVSQFLELLTTQLLQSDDAAPSGLRLHVLDLYLTELAAVGGAELTADQNLTFVEPFCRTAARTKDRTLFSSICSSIFTTIIDQAPFAIEDLMKEMKAADDSDSGQASDEDDEESGKGETRKMEGGKKQVNGKKSDQEEEEFLHLENLDSDSPYDEDVGPVLQFDYSALADKLLEFSGQSGTPGPNRQRLYKIIKILRDLSEGIFPQDEYPEEVSTDEDDDMFASRKRMKRRRRHTEEGEEAGPAVKKGKKKEEEDAADVTAENKKKKKKKKKKKEQPEQTQSAQEEEATQALKATDTDHKDQPKKKKKEAPPTSEPAGAPISEKKSSVDTGTSEVFRKEVTVAPPPESDATTPAKKKKRKKKKADGSAAQIQTAEGEEAAGTIKVTETALHSEATTKPNRQDQPKKKKQKNAETPPTAQLELSEKKKKCMVADTGSCEAEETIAPPEGDAATPAKKKEKKKKKAAAEGEAPVSVGSSETDDTPATGSDAATPAKKKKSITADEEQQAEALQVAKKMTKKKGKQEATTGPTPAETPQKKKKDQREAPEEEEGRQEANAGTTPAKKKKKSRKQEAAQLEAGDTVDSNTEAAVKKKKKRKIPVVFEFEADELQAANGLAAAAEDETAAKKPRRTNDEMATPLSSNTPQKKKKQQGAGGSPSTFITFQSKAKPPTPLFWKIKGNPSMPASGRKKFQTPKSDSKKVTFGLKNNKTAEFRKTDRSLLVSPDGSSRVPFDPQQKPKFGVLKSPPTPLNANVKKTPIRKKKGGAPRTMPTCRPVASDFF